MNFLEGQLLVAASALRTNFFHTVVLLIRHNEEGAFGLVLNRDTETELREVWKQISSDDCPSDDTVRVGGPIQGPLMALHRNRDLCDVEALPGVFFTASREKLEQLVRSGEPTSRFYVGYAGWAQGQLESKLSKAPG